MIEKLCVGVRSFVRSGSDLLFLFVIFVRQRGHGSGGSTSVGNSNSGRCEAPGIWGDRLGGGREGNSCWQAKLGVFRVRVPWLTD